MKIKKIFIIFIGLYFLITSLFIYFSISNTIKNSIEREKIFIKSFVESIIALHKVEILNGNSFSLVNTLEPLLLRIKADSIQIKNYVSSESFDLGANYYNIDSCEVDNLLHILLKKCFVFKNTYYFDSDINHKLLEVNVIKGKQFLDSLKSNAIESVFVFLLISLSSILVIYFVFSYYLISPICKLTQNMNELALKPKKPLKYNIEKIYEINMLNEGISKYIQSKIDLSNEIAKNESNLEKLELVKQVSHDIKSPLTALKIGISLLNSQLPENKIKLLDGAVTRIGDIINDLTISRGQFQENSNESSLVLISDLIEKIVSEKRLEYKLENGFSIIFDTLNLEYGLFANVNIKEFSRLLSNILNNSIYAVKSKQKGLILLNIESSAQFITMTIADNGQGISADQLKELGKYGSTFGKKQGNGLGLFHAKNYLESINGSLQIESKLNKGTKVTIKLKKENIPFEYKKNLILNDKEVIIIDDDPSIHEVWKKKLSQCLNLKSFHSPDEFLFWYNKNKNKLITDKVIFLVDYEYRGFETKGLDLIKTCKIEKSSTLVTSKYSENNIIKECKNSGVKIIPKDQINLIPVFYKGVDDESSIKSVLLDDDDLVHLTWKEFYRHHNINIDYYYKSVDMFENINLFPKTTRFYIDYYLNDEDKGDEIASRLYKLGFREIYLVTGISKEIVKSIPFVKEVRGKEPTFD